MAVRMAWEAEIVTFWPRSSLNCGPVTRSGGEKKTPARSANNLKAHIRSELYMCVLNAM